MLFERERYAFENKYVKIKFTCILLFCYWKSWHFSLLDTKQLDASIQFERNQSTYKWNRSQIPLHNRQDEGWNMSIKGDNL